MRYYETGNGSRYLNPADITVERGYSIEVFAEGLNAPASILFTEDGDMLIANSGLTAGIPSVSILRNGGFEVIAEHFNVPLLGINYRDKKIYVSHKATITTVSLDGERMNIITGLPSYGDYSNCRVDFGPDGKMYFGVGSATNSGVVGTDNLWVPDYSFFCDRPGVPILLRGQNFTTENILISNHNESSSTGAFSPFGEVNERNEMRKGVVKATGSILRANTDGSNIELVAWGVRCANFLKFFEGRLYVSNSSYDVRGSRPIANAPDEFLIINEGEWYGFPDYAGGDPITLPRYAPVGGLQPEFLLSCHPGRPGKPFAMFPPDSSPVGFDFNTNPSFGALGSIYIAEFGSIQLSTIGGEQVLFPFSGYKISQINPFTGTISTFAINRSGFPSFVTREGGLCRPIDVAFGPDGAMYVVDMGSSLPENPSIIIPHTGVIWRITRDDV